MPVRARLLDGGAIEKPTHNTFAKLDVSKRTQAVLAAHERDLLTEVPGSSTE